jgi:hypothetical protein
MGKAVNLTWEEYKLPETYRGFISMVIRWNGKELQCSLQLNDFSWLSTQWMSCNQFNAKSGNGIRKRAEKICPCEKMKDKINNLEMPKKLKKKSKN